LKTRWTIRILAAALVVLTLVPAASAARHSVTVVVASELSLDEAASGGAVGLMIPGAGSSVSRESALASLVRGKVENALLGGKPSGKPKITLGGPRGDITIFVTLPPPGKHHNVLRYPITITGPGYGPGRILVSSHTRLRGLISIADIAPSVEALERGKDPVIESRAGDDPVRELVELDRRLGNVHDSRQPADRTLIAVALGLCVLATLLRSRLLGRAALLSIPSIFVATVIASAVGIDQTAPTVTTVGGVGLVLSIALAYLSTTRHRLALALAFLLGTYGVALAVSPETISLAAIGPHPDGGGRFYGITNQVETLLLPGALACGALVGPLLLPVVALLSIVLVGWSRTGADGGGILVYAAGFAVLALLLLRDRLTWRRVVLATAAVIAGCIALVGLDAATGGSSHVTRAVGDGPAALFDDLGRRIHLSYAGVTDSTYKIVVFLGSVAAIALAAAQRPRSPVLLAFATAVAVSLLVNDSAYDIARFGAVAAATVFVWSRGTVE
jgi:hypothetical protein